MSKAWYERMREALRLTRSGRLHDATATIQRALGAAPPPAAAAARSTAPSRDDDASVIDVEARVVAAEDAGASAAAPAAESPAGRFVAGSFANAAGRRDYKLYVPGGAHARPLPLIVMLHGCTQNPDDFAAGTRMNELAEREGCYVLYPAQASSANNRGCWNWFRKGHQQRDQGEPSILAGMTREIAATHAIDARRVHVAGLSAGGAMAAVLAGTYPELYASVGVHSGLAHGAAHDVVSAFAAMREGPAAARALPAASRAVPTIVFHGDDDATVHPSNGEHVVAQARRTAHGVEGLFDDAPPGASLRVERGHAAGGLAYTRTVHLGADGRPTGIEHWVVHGGGHAWFGGSTAGSFTEPRGPDASREMLRFFAAHPMA